MTWIILQLVFPIVFVGIALYIYRSNHALLVGFREQLAVSPKGRRFVVLTALLALLIYHFVALCGTANPLQLLLSSILAFTLFSQRFGERIIRFFQDRCWSFFIFVVALVGFFMPVTAPLAVTLTVLLVVSWIYPTEELIREVSERGDTSDIIEETIEGLNGVFGTGLYVANPEETQVSNDNGDASSDADDGEALVDEHVEENLDDASASSGQPSEKAIRNRKNREKERKHQRKRAKRKARRAKDGR